MTATTDTGELPVVATAVAAAPVPAAVAGSDAASASGDGDTAPRPAIASVVVPDESPGRTTPPGGRAIRAVLDRLRSLSTRRLTAPGGVVLAAVVLAPGVLLDLALDGTFGRASTVTFVAAGVAAALTVRVRALATAAVLPPLLFVTAVTVLARFSGNNRGNRELVLDVGTTMALSAPVLFAGTVATLAVVLGRLLAGLARR